MKKGTWNCGYGNSMAPITAGVTSNEVTVTILCLRGTRRTLRDSRGKLKSGDPSPTPPIAGNQIIKENGEWKWYGNQK